MSRMRADIPSDRPRQTSDGVGGGQLFELPALDPVLIWCLVSTFVFGLVAHGYRMVATMPGGLAWGLRLRGTSRLCPTSHCTSRVLRCCR